jgi:uncharacterized OB-fold protein
MESAKPKPVPKPGPISRPFWEGAREHRFLLQYDAKAQRHQFFPRPLSLFGSGALEWMPAAGFGVLAAFTRCYTPAPGFEGEVPYSLGLVQLDEGPRVFAQIANATHEAMRVGQRMRLVWDDTRADYPVYQFEPSN